MSALSHKFQIVIQIDLETAAFDVKVANMSARKGFVDIDKLKQHLRDVLSFMQAEGIDSLIEQIEKDQVH